MAQRLKRDTTLRNPETGKHVVLKAGEELPEWVPEGRIKPHKLTDGADAPAWRIVEGETVLNSNGNFAKRGAGVTFNTEAEAADRLAELRVDHPDAAVELIEPPAPEEG